MMSFPFPSSVDPRTLVGLACVAALAPVAALATGSLESTTYIPAGETFLLGGGQPGAFDVQGRNVGAVPVEIVAEAAGSRLFVAIVRPGESVRHRFQPGERARLRNLSADARATMSLQVRGAITSLGMTYDRPSKPPGG